MGGERFCRGGWVAARGLVPAFLSFLSLCDNVFVASGEGEKDSWGFCDKKG